MLLLIHGGLFSDKCGILAFKINTKNIIYIVSTGRGRNNSVVSVERRITESRIWLLVGDHRVLFGTI